MAFEKLIPQIMQQPQLMLQAAIAAQQAANQRKQFAIQNSSNIGNALLKGWQMYQTGQQQEVENLRADQMMGLKEREVAVGEKRQVSDADKALRDFSLAKAELYGQDDQGNKTLGLQKLEEDIRSEGLRLGLSQESIDNNWLIAENSLKEQRAGRLDARERAHKDHVFRQTQEDNSQKFRQAQLDASSRGQKFDEKKWGDQMGLSQQELRITREAVIEKRKDRELLYIHKDKDRAASLAVLENKTRQQQVGIVMSEMQNWLGVIQKGLTSEDTDLLTQMMGGGVLAGMSADQVREHARKMHDHWSKGLSGIVNGTTTLAELANNMETWKDTPKRELTPEEIAAALAAQEKKPPTKTPIATDEAMTEELDGTGIND